MKCPLCSQELEIVPHGQYPQHNNIKCLTPIVNLGYHSSHYTKHPIADWGYFGVIEEIIVYPYLIINHDMTYSEHISPTERIPSIKSTYCSVKKYNPNRMTALKEVSPGFERVLTFPGYIHLDTEDNLRERLKLLLLLS